MKAYTDLEQSKKLAEILSIETADMWWTPLNWQETEYYVEVKQDGINQPKKAIPCWSLSALLSALPSSTLDSSDDHHYRLRCMERFTEWYDNPIDACYEMIIKIH